MILEKIIHHTKVKQCRETPNLTNHREFKKCFYIIRKKHKNNHESTPDNPQACLYNELKDSKHTADHWAVGMHRKKKVGTKLYSNQCKNGISIENKHL